VFTSRAIEHYLGFGRQDVYEKWEGEWDCVFYELRKFIGLLLNCNPNVLSLLWLKPNGIIYEARWPVAPRQPRPVRDEEGLSFLLRIRSCSIQEDDFFQSGSAGADAQPGAATVGSRIDPESTTDGHALKTTGGEPFVGATTEMMEVVKRYKGERRRYYSGGYMGKKRRELVMRVWL